MFQRIQVGLGQERSGGSGVLPENFEFSSGQQLSGWEQEIATHSHLNCRTTAESNFNNATLEQ
jgi:hypothetical protein